MKDPTNCCSCDVCYCGPNCQCTETLCRCEASSVLNSLGMPAPKISSNTAASSCCGSAKPAVDNGKANGQIVAPTKAAAAADAMVVAEWKIRDITADSKEKLEDIFDDSQHLNLEMEDDFLGIARGLVRSRSHAEQLCEGMKAAGLKAQLDFVDDNNKNSQLHEESKARTKPRSSLDALDYHGVGTPKNDPLARTSTIGDVESQLMEDKSSTSPAAATNPTGSQGNATKRMEFIINGMTCSMCTNAIQKALTTIPSVKNVTVSLATNSASVEFEQSDQCDASTLRSSIQDIGYEVVSESIISPRTTTNATTSPHSGGRKVVDLIVGGMTCTMCTTAIYNALKAMDGVDKVQVTLATQVARVECNQNCSNEALREAVEDIGFEVLDVHTVFESTDESGTEQVSSDERLQRLLKQQRDSVDAKKRAFLWSLLGTVPILIMTMILPHVLPATSSLREFLMQQVEIGGHKFILEALVLCVLCSPVQFGSGFSFFKSSYYGVFVQGVLGMDVLVVLGTTSSYVYAATAMWKGTHEYHFFETSAVLICFVLLGKWMNALAVRRTSEALTHLMKLQAKTAIKVSPSQDIETWNPLTHGYDEGVVSVQSIHPGDILKVLKGSSIAADGVLKFGEMSVDESMITGESIPVLKTPGSIVLGGTICVETGAMAADGAHVVAGAFVEVTGVGSSTALSKIIELVQSAQSRQVPIQSFADKIASYFVPSVVGISMATFMVWYALCQSGIVPAFWYEGEGPTTFSLMFAIACLVISCPCALGLATPTAVMVGTGVGARHGVLMKGGETLEVASQVNAVVFDKTGTLTVGKPAITDFIRLVPDSFMDDTCAEIRGDGKVLNEYLLWLLGSLERNSEHPLATAIVNHAQEALKTSKLAVTSFAQPSNFQALTGRGASAVVNGSIQVAAGNRAFVRFMEIPIPPKVEQKMQELERRGKTAILAAINGEICALLGIADQLKTDAPTSVAFLREKGMDVWMVTGDNRRTANAIARQLNLPQNRVISEALPVAKVEQVRKLQSEGRIVAMIGDGVNDSPALAEADVGMSLGTGAEIAAEASDIVLVRGNVSDVCTALDLSRVIFKRIKINLLLSLLYNCLAIPIAAGLLYPLFHVRLPPTVAALAMALSSVSVVLSSISLRLYQPPKIGESVTVESISIERPRSSWRRSGGRRPENLVDEQDTLIEPLLSNEEAEEGFV